MPNNSNPFAPRIPTTWPELRLDGYLTRLCASLVVYFVTLALFWCEVFSAIVLPLGGILAVAFCGIANYVFLTATAYSIQSKLHEAGQQKHGGWQVWVGALILNPVLVGWYIPVSVLFSARRIRRKMIAAAPASA
jgi:hypothetical protein